MFRKCKLIFVLCLVVIISSALSVYPQFDSARFNKTTGPLRITRITPAGNDVPAERQIVFKFNMPVVPVGRMERTEEEIPISIEPPLKGQWRWLNTSSLALQLGDKERMKKSTRYTVTIKPDFVTESGSRMERGLEHTFITQRPGITYYHFMNWRAPGHPVINITFNQKIKRESALANVYFCKDASEEHIPVIQGEEVKNEYSTSLNIEPGNELVLDCLYHVKVMPGIISEEGPERGIEQRTIVTFHTFPEFEFLGISGSDNDDNEIFIEAGKEDSLSNAFKKLSPLKGVSLVFSTPVPPRMEGPKLSFTPDLAGGRTDYDPWAETSRGDYYLSSPHKRGRKYYMGLPEVLKAAQEYHIESTPDFKDVFGRSLQSQIDIEFGTDHRPPTLFVKNPISVLEDKEDTHMPLVITNLREIKVNYRLIDDPSDYWRLNDFAQCEGDFEADQKRSFPAKPIEDVAYYYPFETRQILQEGQGAIAGILYADPPVKSPCTMKFFSQVTNLAVYTKLGHHNTTVWVTSLDKGQPVAHAHVELFLPKGMNLPAASGKTDENGLATLKGIIDLDPYMEQLKGYFAHDGLYYGVVKVTTDGDSALLPLVRAFSASDSDDGYYYDYDYYYNYHNRVKYSHMRAWGTTSQGVYRLGDTIDYKIYVRDQNNRTFIQPELSGYHLTVKDPTGKVVHELKDVTLSEFGSMHGSFTVPQGGSSGWYQFYLKGSFGKNPEFWPLKVLVTDFTPAPFKVHTDIRGEAFKYQDEVTVETTARLHSGGPYGQASTRVTATLESTSFRPKDPLIKNFYFKTYFYGYDKRQIFQEEKELDDKGDLLNSFILQDSSIICGQLTIESAVRDDRGKFIASSSSANYMGRDRLVGLYQEQWTLEEDKAAEFQVVVVDEKGLPAPGTEIELTIEYDRVTGSRVKGAGNAYLMHYTHTREKVEILNLTSESHPLVCTFTPKEAGSYYITATIKDTSQLSHSTSLHKYTIGKGEVLWEMPDDNSLTIIPAQEEYKIGEKARFMVKNPYPGAKALVSIERLGVIKKWTQTFTNNTPIIEFEVEPDYVPGFYLSVVVHSPRVDKPLGENNVDLGKPTFKIGYLRIPVNDPYKQLRIAAHTDKEEYKPRDRVTLNIKVSDIHHNNPKTEVAVVVLDEAVLDLIQGGTTYYDPYKGFYKLGPLDMSNYNLLIRLLGRQKFEKKGANPGGGGGGGGDFTMRSLFKFVSYWNPEIFPDEQGNASVTFTLPDNLTGWRVLAMAVSKDDLMGLGQAHFVTNQYTEIRPAIPNQVTDGDSFQAVFTVMNRTDNPRTLTVDMRAEGDAADAEPVTEKILAKPFIRNKVSLPVKVKKEGKITFKVMAGDEMDKDGLRLELTVHKKQAIEAAATYGTSTAKKVTENFEFPKNMRTDTGKVSVVVSPSIISSLEGAFEYMKEYPYCCWEQRLSKGILAMHYLNLKPYIPDSFQWPDAAGCIAKMIDDASSFQAPNGGMCYYCPQDIYVSPYLSAYTAIAFNWLKMSNYTPNEKVESALHTYLLNLLRKDTFPSFFTKGMSSTVRAVALAALAQNNKVNKGDLSRYLKHVDYMDLFGKAHYLLAATYMNDTGEIQKKVYDMIMSHANETGGKVIFSDSIYGKNLLNEGFGRILTSEIRTNAAVLSALLSLEDGRNKSTMPTSWAPTDTPFKVVRYLTQTRKSRTHWENTQENAFCMHALTTFSRIYDREAPNYIVTASMDNKKFGRAEFDDLRDPPEELIRPVRENDPGRHTKVEISKKGKGRLYYAARLFYSPAELKLDSINSGIEVHREYYVEREGGWVMLDEAPMHIRQGELVRVDLFVSLPAARNFVVVADPVPGGLEPVNRDLATSSVVDADKEAGIYSGSSWWHKYGDWRAYGYSRWSFYHQEFLHHSVRFYSDYLPAGNYHLSYVAQAIAPGEFYVMPLHVEEMYDPDVFGQGVPSLLQVEQERE
ncbi:MAG: alpha-2-macroglobulin family protein [bacterium]